MYLIRCHVLCTLCFPLRLCTFCAYVIQHHFCHVFLCVPSQIVAPYTLHVSRRYTQISRLSFFYPTMFQAFFVPCTDDVGAGLIGLHFTPRGLQLPSFSVVCYRVRPRPLTVSAMLKANLFYTSFYKAVTSFCRGQPRLFFQSALSRPCLTGTCFTPRRSPRGSCRAACGVQPRAFLRCQSRLCSALYLFRHNALVFYHAMLHPMRDVSRLLLRIFDAISGRSF